MSSLYKVRYIPLSSSMYVFVSICEVGFPFDKGLRSGIIVGGITAPADGILYYIILLKSEMYQNSKLANF